MKWKVQEDHKGFTLIELLVSVAILAFVVAPFLGSFVAAGESNVKSKRKQEATDLSQLLAEEFMAKDYDKLELDYGKPREESISADPKDGKRYIFELSNTKIAENYRAAGYKAEVILEPSKNARVNDETITPQINEAEGGNMAVVMSKFFKEDPEARAIAPDGAYRESTITVSKTVDTDSYLVSVRVQYYKNGTLIYDDPKETNLYYKVLPSIYLLYLPYDVDKDVIKIDNNLTDDEHGGKKLEVYLSQQILDPTIENPLKLNKNNISVTELMNGTETLSRISDPNTGLAQKFNTAIYSNVTGNLVPVINEKSLYDMVINIYAGDKKVTSVKTTKIIAD